MKRLHVLSRVFAVVTLMTAFLCAFAGSAAAGEGSITITFKDGDTILYTLNVNKNEQISIDRIPAPEKPGYSFDGWTPSLPNNLKFRKDSTYNAKWTVNQYTINFNTDGGSEIDSIKLDYGSAVTVPANPTKEGFSFAGWEPALPATMPAQNVNVKAKWTAKQYTITFDSNGGSEIDSIKLDYGSAVTAPANPTKEGFSFAGWEPALPKTMPAENMTVKAKWTAKQYTITFDTDGGSEIEPMTLGYGAAVTAPEEPTKDGYTFAGWEGLPATMPAQNVNVKAKWTVNQYTITFDTDGGTAVSPITKNFGAAVTAPTAPTKEGFSFAGWEPALPATMPAQNVNVKAKWTAKQYTITFDSNGGSEIDPIELDYGSAVTAPTAPTKVGFSFAGWEPALPKTMPAQNVNVKAKWTANPTITFNMDGGEPIDPITLAGGQKLFAPANLEKTGYEFGGWVNEKGEEVDFPNTMPENGMTLKAKWTPIAYSIYFDLGGGEFVSVPGPESYTIESDTFKLPIPTREGYKFIGWTVTPVEKMKLKASPRNSGEQEPQMTVEIQQGSVGDMAFTANWEANPAGAESLSGSVEDYDLPQTGDSSHLMIWGAALAVSGCLLAGMLLRKKKTD